MTASVRVGQAAVRVLGGYLGLAIIVAIIVLLVAVGVLPARRWEPFSDLQVWRFLGQGLGATLQIGGLALVASLILSVPLAIGRIALPAPVRVLVVAWIELVRATPVLALVLVTVLLLPRLGIDMPAIWSATLALTFYTSAVLAEIMRAGILAIPHGEVQAARSLGLTYVQTMRLVVLPQAISRMMPAIVSQLITLVKDTSLVSIAGISELVGHARSSFVFFGNPIETLFVVACIYFVICYTLSRVARRLELRTASEVAVPAPIGEEGAATARVQGS